MKVSPIGALVGLALTASSLGAQIQQQANTLAAMPLANYPAGPQMMADAIKNLTLDVSFKFLDKTYENDVYVKDPITGTKMRTACIRFRSSAGFAFRASAPTFQLTTQGLAVTQVIDRIDAEGLNVKVQVGPCADVSAGIGVKLRDVTVTYKARPMVKIEQNSCQITLNPVPGETRVSIGDLNILGVQNNIDKLAKDAVREALNLTLANFLNSGLGSGLARASVSVCGANTRR